MKNKTLISVGVGAIIVAGVLFAFYRNSADAPGEVQTVQGIVSNIAPSAGVITLKDQEGKTLSVAVDSDAVFYDNNGTVLTGEPLTSLGIDFVIDATGKASGPETLVAREIRIRAGLAEYKNEDFKVTVQYPAIWQADKVYTSKGVKIPLHFVGPSGFFGIDGVGGQLSITDAVQSMVKKAGNSYGSNPVIKNIVVAGHDAWRITASGDQPASELGKEAVVISYSTPAMVNGLAIRYLVFYANTQMFDTLLSRLQINE